MSDTVSESENPAIPVPDAGADRPRTNEDWWPNQLEPGGAPPALATGQPAGRGLRLRGGVQTLDLEALKQDVVERDDDVAGLVAGRLRPLRAALHPDDVARRRHLPHRRRPGRWRHRRPALRPAQQLARQRQPRQGAPAALADQAEVRPEDLLGRPDHLRRQLRPASRWGSRRSASAFGREDIWEPEEIFWGPEDTWLGDERYSGDRELAKPFGAVQMGLIYVNPEGPNGNPDPLAAAQGHPRDVRPHGDERRGDASRSSSAATRSARPTARSTPSTSVPNPRAARIEQQGLGWKNSFGSGKGADALTSGLEGAWTNEPTKWDNGFLDNLFNVRLGADEEPGRCAAVDAQESRGARAPCRTRTIRRSGTPR